MCALTSSHNYIHALLLVTNANSHQQPKDTCGHPSTNWGTVVRSVECGKPSTSSQKQSPIYACNWLWIDSWSNWSLIELRLYKRQPLPNRMLSTSGRRMQYATWQAMLLWVCWNASRRSRRTSMSNSSKIFSFQCWDPWGQNNNHHQSAASKSTLKCGPIW